MGEDEQRSDWICYECESTFYPTDRKQSCPSCGSTLTIPVRNARLIEGKSMPPPPPNKPITPEVKISALKSNTSQKSGPKLLQFIGHAKCPSCKEYITENDLAPLLTPLGGVAWVCKKCNTIIGFENSKPLSVRTSTRSEGEALRRMDDDRMMFEHFYR